MQTLRKLCQLSPREFWLLAQAAVLLPVVHLALPRRRVAELLRLAEEHESGSSRRGLEIRGSNPQSPIRDPQSTARLVRIAAQRGLYRAKCLEQSLVLRWLLRRQGIDAQIVFGARKEKEDDQVQAHAWVEANGMALNEDNGTYQYFLPLSNGHGGISCR